MHNLPRQTFTRWNEDIVRNELSNFLKDWDVFPSAEDFQVANKGALIQALRKYGGATYWAEEFNLPRKSEVGQRTARNYIPWTEERVREELAIFIQGRNFWPSHDDFINEGQSRLLNAYKKYKSANEWANDFNLPRKYRSGHPASVTRTRHAKG